MVIVNVEQAIAEDYGGFFRRGYLLILIRLAQEARKLALHPLVNPLFLGWLRVFDHNHLVLIIVGCEPLGENICGLPGFHQASDVVILVLQRLVLEPKSRCLDSSLVIKYDVEGKLFSTDSVLLAAAILDLDSDEFLKLFVEWQISVRD